MASVKKKKKEKQFEQVKWAVATAGIQYMTRGILLAGISFGEYSPLFIKSHLPGAYGVTANVFCSYLSAHQAFQD